MNGEWTKSTDGWAYYGQVPATLRLELASVAPVSWLRVVTGWDREDHALMEFKVKVRTGDHQWVTLTQASYILLHTATICRLHV